MRKQALALIFLILFSISAFSFTVTTAISNANEEIRWDLSQKLANRINLTTSTTKSALLDEVEFKIDASSLKNWHGEYSFVPHLYWPELIEEGKNPGERHVSFKVVKNNRQLDCAFNTFQSYLHSAGEEQRCDVDKETPHRDGVVKYRIDEIRGPDYELSRKIAWWIFKLADFYSIQGTGTGVEIDFSVAFRTDNETGSGGTFTEFVSTQEELEALGLSSEGQSDEIQETYTDCAPVVKRISYGGETFEEPEEFHYNSFGDLFSVVFTTGECEVEDFRIGFWDSQGLRGNPKQEIELLSSEIKQINSVSVLGKQISLSESDYPEKLFFGARLENPVTVLDLAGCNPCTSIPGCLACLDYILMTNSE